MDLRVLEPDKWQVAGTAYKVPKDLIRTVPESHIEGYVVPVEFDLDKSIVFVQCTEKMTIKNLKHTISKLRGIQPYLLNFVAKSDRNLTDESKIPNDYILCSVCQLN